MSSKEAIGGGEVAWVGGVGGVVGAGGATGLEVEVVLGRVTLVVFVGGTCKG